jgi:hypothetical protein
MTMPAATASPCSQFAVAEPGLDGVAEGVAEVQQRALAGLALVGGDHLGLVAAGALDGLRQRGAVAGQQRLHVLASSQSKEGRVADQPVLDHLGQPGGQLALRQGAQRVGVAMTARGWWKAPIMFLPSG